MHSDDMTISGMESAFCLPAVRNSTWSGAGTQPEEI